MEEQQFSTLIYYLNVKRPMDLLISFFDIFSSDQTMISLEGDLSYCDTRGLKVILQEPHGILDEQIIPKEGRLILSLISSSKDCFVRNIFPRIGIRKRIWHILISISNRIVFASYDRFDEDCVWITADVNKKWLEDLVELRIIKSFKLMKAMTNLDKKEGLFDAANKPG